MGSRSYVLMENLVLCETFGYANQNVRCRGFYCVRCRNFLLGSGSFVLHHRAGTFPQLVQDSV